MQRQCQGSGLETFPSQKEHALYPSSSSCLGRRPRPRPCTVHESSRLALCRPRPSLRQRPLSRGTRNGWPKLLDQMHSVSFACRTRSETVHAQTWLRAVSVEECEIARSLGLYCCLRPYHLPGRTRAGRWLGLLVEGTPIYSLEPGAQKGLVKSDERRQGRNV